MKLPMCESDALKGMLCVECEARMSKGTFSDLDFTVSKFLVKNKEKFNLETSGFEKVVDIGPAVVIVTKGKVGPLVGRGGAVVKALNKELKKLVRVVGFRDLRSLVSDLVAPSRVVTINKIYKSDGVIEYVVVVSKERNARLVANPLKLGDALFKLTGNVVKLKFV